MPARNRRLPRDQSWPLTTTDIRTVLGVPEAGVYSLSFHERPMDDGTLLTVIWNPPISSNYSFAGSHSSPPRSVGIGIVPLPATDRAEARNALRQHALPELAAWIDAVRHAPETWTLTQRRRSWRLAGNSTAYRDDWQPYQ
ncbi:hypothetical protein P3T37_004812 [Kitasatospora sp. MAA4]|uniref:hypothetical protein n=1 Tax=Kitasatospora sp. MAA4 TaxID=3035093 RepID=UPI002473A34D|nr:hypothetical protein [Kitasatospora sp. MAA4]MDH6135397.1 hypothetical protein [Kitasatospora sp. MAA4]